jgi:hypothetical protein
LLEQRRALQRRLALDLERERVDHLLRDRLRRLEELVEVLGGEAVGDDGRSAPRRRVRRLVVQQVQRADRVARHRGAERLRLVDAAVLVPEALDGAVDDHVHVELRVALVHHQLPLLKLHPPHPRRHPPQVGLV